jgi:undecaprenyl-diphosphatase
LASGGARRAGVRADGRKGLTPGRAAALGAAQGAAEVFPVSSSAQLALLPELLGWEQPPHRTAFAAALHAGSTVGIAWALRGELVALARQPERALGLLATCAPAAVVGLAVDDAVERRLGGATRTAALLAGAGVVMALADRRPQDVPGVGRPAALAAAVAQLLALAPGVSRAGATLTALRLCRVERGEAARFSLLMALPVTGGAALVPLTRSDRETLRRLGPLLATGVPAAAVSGALAATAWRRRPDRPLAGAAVYRLGMAALVLARSHSRSRPG